MSDAKIICSGCGAELAEGQAFCGNCGTKYTPPAPPVTEETAPLTYNCANCGAELAPGQAFCGHCGSPAMPAAPAAPVIPVCANCGTELAVGQAFCSVCGTKATATMAPGVSASINQFNANIETKKKKKPIVPIIIGAAVVVIILIIVLVSGGNKKDFNDMFSGIKHNSWCTISSDGSYMTIDTNPNDDDDYIDLTAYYTIESINEELGFPASTYEKMGETRALDGRQYDETSEVEASWTYHPDKGLEIIYEWKD